MLIKRADGVWEAPDPKKRYLNGRGGKVNSALKTPVWADRDGGCSPLLPSGFPAKQNVH